MVMTERLHKPRAHRHRVFKGAKAMIEGHWAGVECIVRNISTSGAKITCKDPFVLPSEFALLISSEHTVQNVRVIWRSDEALGLQFTSERVPSYRGK